MSILESCSRTDLPLVDHIFNLAVDQCLAVSDNFPRSYSKDLIISKLQHTEDVVQATNDIISEGDFNLNRSQAVAIARLHDIGRFFEAANFGSFHTLGIGDRETNCNHAEEGLRHLLSILDKNPQLADAWTNLQTNGFDLDTILAAIFYHNVKEYNGSDAYILLIRDADKLALLRNFDSRGVDLPDGEPSFVVLEEILAGKLVANDKVANKTDDLIHLFAYLLDLNFDTTRRLCLQDNFLEGIIRRIQKYSTSNETIETMISVVLENWNRKSSTIFTREDFPLVTFV